MQCDLASRGRECRQQVQERMLGPDVLDVILTARLLSWPQLLAGAPVERSEVRKAVIARASSSLMCRLGSSAPGRSAWGPASSRH